VFVSRRALRVAADCGIYAFRKTSSSNLDLKDFVRHESIRIRRFDNRKIRRAISLFYAQGECLNDRTCRVDGVGADRAH
jgi:hypothetical protein